MPTARLPEFLLTVFVLIVIPGPSVLFVVSRGVALGRRAALATVVGNSGGLALQALLVAIGIGSLLQESEAVFTVVSSPAPPTSSCSAFGCSASGGRSLR